MKRILIVSLVLAVVVLACGTPAPIAAPLPTATPYPTYTPYPTPIPTVRPIPTQDPCAGASAYATAAVGILTEMDLDTDHWMVDPVGAAADMRYIENLWNTLTPPRAYDMAHARCADGLRLIILSLDALSYGDWMTATENMNAGTTALHDSVALLGAAGRQCGLVQ